MHSVLRSPVSQQHSENYKESLSLSVQKQKVDSKCKTMLHIVNNWLQVYNMRGIGADMQSVLTTVWLKIEEYLFGQTRL